MTVYVCYWDYGPDGPGQPEAAYAREDDARAWCARMNQKHDCPNGAQWVALEVQ